MGHLKTIIGDRIRNLRKDRGLNQEELAHRANVHFTYIGKLERGELNVTIESLDNVMKALDVPLDDLFRFIHPSKEGQNDHTLSQIINLLQSRSIEDQKKALHLLQFVLEWKEK